MPCFSQWYTRYSRNEQQPCDKPNTWFWGYLNPYWKASNDESNVNFGFCKSMVDWLRRVPLGKHGNGNYPFRSSRLGISQLATFDYRRVIINLFPPLFHTLQWKKRWSILDPDTKTGTHKLGDWISGMEKRPFLIRDFTYFTCWMFDILQQKWW